MNLIYNDPDLLRYFRKYVLAPFKVLGINPEPFLLPYIVYLGIDPTPETAFPNVDPEKKNVELPFGFCKIFSKEPRYIIEDSKLGVHEVFHTVHLAPGWDWDKWAAGTGNQVKLEYVNAQIQVPSWEKVAWDGAELLNFNLADWYIDYLGGKKNLDYRIGNSAYILTQAGLMGADRFNKIRDSILEKYV